MHNKNSRAGRDGAKTAFCRTVHPMLGGKTWGDNLGCKLKSTIQTSNWHRITSDALSEAIFKAPKRALSRYGQVNRLKSGRVEA